MLCIWHRSKRTTLLFSLSLRCAAHLGKDTCTSFRNFFLVVPMSMRRPRFDRRDIADGRMTRNSSAFVFRRETRRFILHPWPVKMKLSNFLSNTMPISIVNLRMVSRLCIWLRVRRVSSWREQQCIGLFSSFAEENHLEVVKFLLANGANQSLATEVRFLPFA